MSSWGSCDFSSLRALSDRLHTAAQPVETDRLYQKIMQELADALRKATVEKTPEKTGHLRRSWQIGQVTKRGDTYEIEVFNNVSYAPFVENGHRIVRNGTTVGYCEGVYMLRLSAMELERAAPGITQAMAEAYLQSVMGGF